MPPETEPPPLSDLQVELDPKWTKYVCGRTRDQLMLTQQAHILMRRAPHCTPRSLNFYKTEMAV